MSRALALGALLAAVTAIVVLVVGGGPSYQLHAVFANASQLVTGDQVEVAGTPVGSVTKLSLTPNGQADVTMSLDAPDVIPVHRGVQAVVRLQGLTGVANRYVDLRLPDAGTPALPSGATLPAAATSSAVDLDEVLNTFDSPTRRALGQVIRGSGAEYQGKGQTANLGFLFLDPEISTTDALLSELDRDTPLLERFVVANAQLASDVASRGDALGNLVDNLSTATGAIAVRQRQLADALATLPPFMRQADTTFVNLRSVLDRLTPMVDASKPVAPKLSPLFAALRSLAANAGPTLADLAAIISRPGPNNDLIDLMHSSVPVRNIAVGPVFADGAQRPGAFPASTAALNGATPELAFGRPYGVDLAGWFQDFSHTGLYDALGGASRSLFITNAFSLQGGTLQPIPPDLRPAVFSAVARTGLNNRCPGADERSVPGSPLPWYPYPGYPCDPTQGPLGK